MELELRRLERTEVSTIGELYINGIKECYILEDKDRGLKQTDSLESINKRKIMHLTAIPSGRYRVVISFSNRFQKYLPELLEVPGYAGIRIHSGNSADSSSGCLITGQTKAKDFVGNSRLAFDSLFKKLKAVEKKEKIYITIK